MTAMKSCSVLVLALVVLSGHGEVLVAHALISDLRELRRLDGQDDPSLFVALFVDRHLDGLLADQKELLGIAELEFLPFRALDPEPGQARILFLRVLGEIGQLWLNLVLVLAGHDRDHFDLDLVLGWRAAAAGAKE